VLAARGVAPEEARAYLDPRLRDLMPDPSALTDMDAAAARLAKAARRGERIAIFADYDVDGAASAALLARWLRALGREATVYVPDRIEEGYGPNAPAMRALGEAHDLVICVDCGTAAPEPVAAAMAAGADVWWPTTISAPTRCRAATRVVNPNRPDDGVRASAISARRASPSCCWRRRTGRCARRA
jgi:single-stranded-DNA-specific exonuclease